MSGSPRLVPAVQRRRLWGLLRYARGRAPPRRATDNGLPSMKRHAYGNPGPESSLFLSLRGKANWPLAFQCSFALSRARYWTPPSAFRFSEPAGRRRESRLRAPGCCHGDDGLSALDARSLSRGGLSRRRSARPTLGRSSPRCLLAGREAAVKPPYLPGRASRGAVRRSRFKRRRHRPLPLLPFRPKKSDKQPRNVPVAFR